MSGLQDAELTGTRYINLTTFRRNGTPVTTPVWIVSVAGLPHVFSDAAAGKAKRVRATSRIRVVPCDIRGQNEFGTPREGTARVLTDADTVRRVQLALQQKYGRWRVRVILWLYRLRGARAAAALELHLS